MEHHVLVSSVQHSSIHLVAIGIKRIVSEVLVSLLDIFHLPFVICAYLE